MFCIIQLLHLNINFYLGCYLLIYKRFFFNLKYKKLFQIQILIYSINKTNQIKPNFTGLMKILEIFFYLFHSVSYYNLLIRINSTFVVSFNCVGHQLDLYIIRIISPTDSKPYYAMWTIAYTIYIVLSDSILLHTTNLICFDLLLYDIDLQCIMYISH